MQRVIAADIGGYDVLKVEDVPCIPHPQENQVTINVHACGFNFFDLYVRHGFHPTIKPPCALGLECAGFVKEVGSNVKNFKEGDRVVAINFEGGAFCDIVCVNEGNVLKIPDTVTFEKAAALSINYLTAYFCLHQVGNLKEGGSLFLQSCAGGVGCAATQLAKLIPQVTVYGQASKWKHDSVGKNGVDVVFDNSQDVIKEMSEVRSNGVSLIIESDGINVSSLIYLLEPLGKLVMIGAKAPVQGESTSMIKKINVWLDNKGISPTELVMNNISVGGLNIDTLHQKDPNTFRQAWASLLDMCGKNVINPIINRTFSFDEIGTACKYMSERKNIGKIILLPNKFAPSLELKMSEIEVEAEDQL